MQLNLSKPLVLFDLETTGTNVASDRIIEISMIKVFPDGKTETKTRRVNPGMPIPAKSSEIHGIFDHDVADMPRFKELAGQFFGFLEQCDLGGYNCIKFDIPLLVEEFLRCGYDLQIKERRVVDVQNIFHIMEPRTLAAAYRFYCGKNLENAHTAEADVLATFEVLLSQIERYADAEIKDPKGNLYKPVQNDMQALHNLCETKKFADLAGRIIFDEDGNEVFNFGKYNGKKVVDVLKQDPGYYSWMQNGDFPEFTKKVLTGIKLRGLNTKGS